MKSLDYFKNLLIKFGYKPKYENLERDYLVSYTYIKDGREVTLDLESGIVNYIFIESNITNEIFPVLGVDFKKGILLTNNPKREERHTLDLFEKCLEINENLFEHKLFILKNHAKNLTILQKTIIPILSKFDYTVEINNVEDLFVLFRHYNGDFITAETDILTGKLIFSKNLDLLDKSEQEIYSELFNKIWKLNESMYSYLYSNDPKNTKDSHREIQKLYTGIREDIWYDINTDILPDKYKQDYIDYETRRSL